MKTIGVVIADAGAAIVTVEREPFLVPLPDVELVDESGQEKPALVESGDDSFLTTGIERLPFDLKAVAQRVLELDDPDLSWVIDGDGLGTALWTVVGGADNRNHWQLYSGRGLERQALVDELVIAIQEGRFHFAPALAEQPAMSKAMVGYRRQVKEDGLIGSELVVALLLAIRPLPVESWFAYA